MVAEEGVGLDLGMGGCEGGERERGAESGDEGASGE
jgi:hypothetical protein